MNHTITKCFTDSALKRYFFRGHIFQFLVRCVFFSPYVPNAPPTRAKAAGRRPAPPRRRLHNDSHQADPSLPGRRSAQKNTAHERYRRRPPWPQACARVACAATAMTWGCMRPLWMPLAAGAHDWRHLQGRQRAGGRKFTTWRDLDTACTSPLLVLGKRLGLAVKAKA